MGEVVTMPARVRLLDAPPETKRPEPRCSHDIEFIEAMETPMIWAEIVQRLSVLRHRHGLVYTLVELDDRLVDL